MNIKHYVVTLKHDKGKVNLLIPIICFDDNTDGTEQAQQLACSFENAPKSAIVKTKLFKTVSV